MALTKQDLGAIGKIVKVVVNQSEKRIRKDLGGEITQSEQRIRKDLSGILTKNYVGKFEFKKAIDDLKKQINLLPTKNEYFTAESNIVGELHKTREEQTMLSFRVSTHSDQIEELQSHFAVN